MSYQTAPRRPVVTARESIKVGVMRDMIPLTAEEHGQRSARGFTPVVVTDKDGFQSVRAGWEVKSDKARGIGSVTVNPKDAIDKIEGVWYDGEGNVVRTVEMGDARLPRLPKIKPDDSPEAVSERKARAAARKAAGMGRSEDRPVKSKGPSDAYVRAVISHMAGRPYTGPIDRKIRAMVMDVISNQESVARYCQK